MAEKIKKASPYFLILVLVGLIIAFNFWSSLDKNLWKKYIEAAEEVGSSVSVGNSTPEIKEPFCVYGTGITTVTLVENTGVDLMATVTIEDANGCTDIQEGNVEAWFYTSDESVTYGTATCDYDENNCYDNTVVSCSFESCSGTNTATYQCVASGAWKYFADATKSIAGGIASKNDWEWVIMVVASDSSGAEVASYSNTAASNSAEIQLYMAMDVERGSDSIAYGTLSIGETSNDGTLPALGITNTGNRGLDPIIEETASMSYGAYTIGTKRQKYHTATFTILTAGTSLSADNTITALDLNLPQRGDGEDGNDEYTSISDDQIYWGIDIPITQFAGDYEGSVSYTAVQD